MIWFLPKFTKVYDMILKLSIFLFTDGDVPCSTSYGVYIESDLLEPLAMLLTSTLAILKLFTQKLLKQKYQYHKLRKKFFSPIQQFNI